MVLEGGLTMAKTTRKELEKLVAEINELTERLHKGTAVYVLNYAKYEGGYQLQRYTANKQTLLYMDNITERLRFPAGQMYTYLLGVRNTLCEMQHAFVEK